MSPCDALVQNATGGVAASLRAVDCVSAEATATAFTRLFGTHGALLPAMTILLTIYIAAFAILLLTGRSTLSVRSLTPRMFTLGLVLTFTTSWVAYQAVVWNLASGAPDQIAGILLGTHGSATQVFADRIDLLFNAITETASVTGGQGAARGGAAPVNLLWLSAVMLLLGTVGVLVTARIALAILLGLGPVFIAFVLFRGTRGLFAGWLRAVVLMALTPLFAVLGGALMTELAAPVVAALRDAPSIDGRAAMALFLIASVHCALMALAIGVASTMVSGWRVFGQDSSVKDSGSSRDSAAPVVTTAAAAPASGAARARTVMPAAPSLGMGGQLAAPAAGASTRNIRNITIPATASGAAFGRTSPRRARGIGSRFASPVAQQRKF